VMARGNRREPIFLDQKDGKQFVKALGEVCAMTGWRVYAWVLLSNHYRALWWGRILKGVLPKSHILENRRSLKVQIILAEHQNAPQVNLARHVFLGFANGGLGNTSLNI